MVTNKSTVLGIRLDHERRAWIEAEAARRGVSVRGLFEGMIDGARAGDAELDAAAGVAGAEPVDESFDERRIDNELTCEQRADEESVTASTAGVDASSSTVNTPSHGSFGSSPWPDFGSVTVLPRGMIRGAFSLTTGLVKSSSRCALNRLESCPVTKHWVGRSA